MIRKTLQELEEEYWRTRKEVNGALEKA